MANQEVKIRIEKLKKLINHHRYLQHVLDRQEISESALDSLKKELFDLEQKYPSLITADSPTQRVAGKPLGKFKKVKHPKPMLSFNDAFSRQDMKDWLERNLKLLDKVEGDKSSFPPFATARVNEISNVKGYSSFPTLRSARVIDFFCEPKLDGLAIELIYENGIFKTGATRGDGVLGEDVTQNLKTIEAIPLKLREMNEKGLAVSQIMKEVVVRGEAIINKKIFELVNQEQKKSGQTPFANPRNLAAGSIRQLDPKITGQRKLEFSAYDLLSEFGQETHSQEHKILESLGFKTNNKFSKHCKNLAEVFDFHDYWLRNREELPYEIDGLVVIINNNKIFDKLGVVGKAPRGAIAFKFPLKEATTVIEDIEVQVGRTGAITPVAILKPVQIGGVTISRATLHNEDEIKRLKLKIGDTVVVGRAGDVIPDIVRVLPELRTGKEREFRLPKNCPVCGKKLIKPAGQIPWRCSNSKCPARQRRYFYYFVSKSAFNIAGLGPKIIDKLADNGLISDPADLFTLEIGDILPFGYLSHLKHKAVLPRFAEKSAQNLISAIQLKKKITLARFIYALGIRNAGEETARDLAEFFGNLEKFKKTSLEELEKIKDVGPVVARSIFDWLSLKKNQEFLEKLKKAGVEIIEEKKLKHRPLKGKIFVLTGSLETLTRERAKEKIFSLGGDFSELISKKTDYLVAGKEPGSKLRIAKDIGVKIINEKEFLNMIKQ